jgi:hypothetical protein
MTDPRQRGGCLTAWLVLMILSGAFVSTMNFFITDIGSQYGSGGDGIWVFAVYGIAGLAMLVGAIVLMLWKRWGFWAICAAAVVNLGLQIYQGYPYYMWIWAILSPLILFLLLRQQWDDFA